MATFNSGYFVQPLRGFRSLWAAYCAAKLAWSRAEMKNWRTPDDACLADLAALTTATPSGPTSVGISTVSRSTPDGADVVEWTALSCSTTYNVVRHQWNNKLKLLCCSQQCHCSWICFLRFSKSKNRDFLRFYARLHICYSAYICYRPSDCLSVRLSLRQTGGSYKNGWR